MEISADLAADLELLTQALDDTELDIADTLMRLMAAASSAVASLIGLSVRIGLGAYPIVFTKLDAGTDPAMAKSSLVMPMTIPGTDELQIDVILYSDRAGAFVDLAADTAWLTGRPLTDLVLDQHIPMIADRRTTAVVRAVSTINQAIGALLERGFTIEEARQELQSHAMHQGTSRLDAAETILAGLGK